MTAQLRDRLGRFGIWRGAYQVTAPLAAAVEEAGFGALWLGSSPDVDLVQVAARLGQHLDAGADHVVIQLLTEPGADPVPGYRDLARALRM